MLGKAPRTAAFQYEPPEHYQDTAGRVVEEQHRLRAIVVRRRHVNGPRRHDGASLADQHRIAIAVEAITLGHRFVISGKNRLTTSQGHDEE